MSVDPLTAFDPLRGTPVTVVFGTFNYRQQVLEWVEAAQRGACDHWRILCMDAALQGWLDDQGYGAHTVDYYDLLPDAPRPDFPALDRKARMRVLMPLRTRLLLHLLRAGRDFIHSDADAIWIRDPRDWLAQHSGLDLLASQGTMLPWGAFLRRRFVLCAGFFQCRANERTVSLFESMAASEDWDDQRIMNRILLKDPEGRWEVGERIILTKMAKHSIWKPPSKAMRLVIAPFRMLCERGLPGGKLTLRRPLKYMVTSPEVMLGTFNSGLTVGVIPFHLVSRRMPVTAQTLVQHGLPR